MSESPSAAANGRPVIITIICILAFIGILFAIPLIFSSYAAQIGSWYPPFLAVSTLVGLVSLIGFWLMRLWGLYLYCVLFVLNQIVLMMMHVWTPVALFLPLVIVIIGFCYRARMR